MHHLPADECESGDGTNNRGIGFKRKSEVMQKAKILKKISNSVLNSIWSTLIGQIV